MIGFDSLVTNYNCLMSLPFREGSGVITKDHAKPEHDGIALVGAPAWASLLSGIGVLQFNGATDYLECPAVNCADLNFITEDYTLIGWINYQARVGQSQLLIGRYGVDLDGWELYLHSDNETLSLRHHHASLAPARDGCYSEGWTVNEWHLFGISRNGLYPRMFRDGAEVEVTYDPAGGLRDPDACNRDLVIGARYTKDDNWYKGYMQDLRILGGVALTPALHKLIFERERHWFGV